MAYAQSLMQQLLVQPLQQGLRLRQKVQGFLLFVMLLFFISTQVIADEITLNLKDADIRALISTVSKFTGKNFIIDPRVKAKVTVISATT